MSVIVSFCVFGEDPGNIYVPGALKQAALYNVHHPDWRMVFYIGRSARALIPSLRQYRNIHIEICDGPEDQTATFWRFRALREFGADFYLFRDVDSRLIARERMAVAEWMDSGRNFHVIRDHPFHSVPILAGLWGCTKFVTHRIPDSPQGFREIKYGIDQTFLWQRVWPTAKRDLYASVDCQWAFGTPVHSIPGDLSEGFCGMGWNGDDTPRIPKDIRGNLVPVAPTAEILR